MHEQLQTHIEIITLYSIHSFKALFRVDINHTYNTSSNELLKSTMVYGTAAHASAVHADDL
jgi:hypothetical protein